MSLLSPTHFISNLISHTFEAEVALIFTNESAANSEKETDGSAIEMA